MPVSLSRLNALKSSGYKYHFTNDIYINKTDKVIISKEAIEDHDDNWLNERLEACDGNSWLFIFTNGSPRDAVKNKILKDLGLM
ncbi:hypothetical protein [Legionella feeleii]|uniref:Uncharacterized protein n=1 Tax=Legionella feeleii TaxID=453 RepID=A0A0W0U4S5_9GAMM|nr:hypothetical protein [Legionella feeleii]KTD02896.1 hypothetical protein Lfee_0649 [Legionella feeleii]SPX59718.1 Uncharacterised protein [Legionella feeleii]